MTATKTVHLPVRYTVSDPVLGGHRSVVTPGAVEIRDIDPAEMPVALEIHKNGKVVEGLRYRVFDGRLWCLSRANRVYNYSDPDGTEQDPLAWRHHVSGDAWHRAYYHPLLDNDSRPPVLRRQLNDVLFKPDGTDSLLYARYLSDARAKAARHVMLDGEVWAPCLGPVLCNDPYNAHLRYFHVEEPMDVYSGQSIPLIFDPFDVDEAVRHVEFATGEVGDRPETELVVLSAHGYSIDTLPMAVQGAAFGMLWVSRRSPVGKTDEHRLSAVVSLREALIAAWPSVTLDFAVSRYQEVTNPLLGHPLPEPAPLLPVLEKAVDAITDAFPKDVTAIRQWRSTLERLRSRVNLIPKEDLDTIEGLAF